MPACFTDCRFVRASRSWVVGGLLLAFSALHGFAADPGARFSKTLTKAEQTEAGLPKLTDDNIAVIDALVRQDEAAAARTQSSTTAIRGNFSDRRNAHEHTIAGLDQLKPEQLARLNELIERRTAVTSPTLTAELGSPSPPVSIRRAGVTQERPALEVHGSVTLTYGWSKAGDIRGGSMVISVQDPAHPNFKLQIGYSEYRGKGLSPYYDPIDDDFRYRRASSPEMPIMDPRDR